MAKSAKVDKKHMSTTVRDSSAIPANDDPVELACYNPKEVTNPGDKILSSTIVPGKYLRNEDELIGVSLLEAKRASHARRVSIVACPETEAITKAHSVGIGVSFSGVPGSESTAGAGSLGFATGKSTSTRQEHEVLFVYGMNDGPADPPANVANGQPSKLDPAAGVQTLRIEVVAVAPSLALTANTNLAGAALLPSTDPCVIDQFSAHFAFDNSALREEDKPGVAKIAEWVKAHPACKVQVKGHASTEASSNYNAALGQRRAKTVYEALLAAGVPSASMEYASLGKEFPSSEYQPENRRVILQVLGAASGK
jgi:outer membrane protein OmpA-like peptidoglycan-associated protein